MVVIVLVFVLGLFLPVIFRYGQSNARVVLTHVIGQIKIGQIVPVGQIARTAAYQFPLAGANRLGGRVALTYAVEFVAHRVDAVNERVTLRVRVVTQRVPLIFTINSSNVLFKPQTECNKHY
jgi:hypothetical protein